MRTGIWTEKDGLSSLVKIIPPGYSHSITVSNSNDGFEDFLHLWVRRAKRHAGWEEEVVEVPVNKLREFLGDSHPCSSCTSFYTCFDRPSCQTYQYHCELSRLINGGE